MANNLGITLEIDGQKYLAEINRAQQATKQFATNAVADGQKVADSFKKIEASTGALATGFNKLKGVLAGAAFVGFARSAIQLGADLKDLSESTGVAVDQLIRLREALSQNSGNADDAGRAVTTLFQKIDEAAQGGASAQEAFARVGVTLNDLRTLSEGDILKKTAQGLAAMGPSAERTALSAELLGKAFKGVNLGEDFVRTLTEGNAKTQEAADATARAAALNDLWSKTWDELRLAFLQAFAPMLAGITELIARMPNLITLFKVLGAVIVGVFVATGLRTFVGLIGSAVRGVEILAKGIKGLGKGGKGISVSQATTGASAIAGGVGLVGGAVAAGDLLFNENTELNKQLDDLTNKYKGVGTAGGTGLRTVKDALQPQKDAIKAIGDAYDDTAAKGLKKIKQDIKMIGMSEDQKEAYRAVQEVTQTADAEIEKLNAKKIAGQGKLNTEVDAEIERIKKKRDETVAATEKEINGKQIVAKVELARLKTQESLYDLQNKVKDIQDKYYLDTLTGTDKMLAQVEIAERKVAKAAMDRWEIENRGLLTSDPARYTREQQTESARLQAIYRANVSAQQTALRQGESNARSFASGWNRAFKEYVDAATNASQIAANLFNKAMSGMEDMIVNFAKTGKLEWKSFVASMAEELLRSQIKQAFSTIMTGMSQSTGILGSIGSLLGLTGGAGAGNVVGQTPNNPMWVKDVSGGLNSAFGGGGGAFGGGQQPGGGIFGGISNVFSGISNTIGNVASSIGNVFSGVTSGISDLISGGGFGGGGGGFFDSITSGIGDFFDGFFANGGNIGAGRFGVVGERGPEFVSGPATVTPMGGGGSVTYNINAVDAASFKSLVAADPGFIHAVAQMGGRSVPSRR